MKKYLMAITVLLSLTFCSSAWAITGFSSYFTNGDGIYDTYSGLRDDTPYLYLKIDGLQANESFSLSSYWDDNDSADSMIYFASSGNVTSDEIWIALTSPYSSYEWTDAGVGKIGDWTIRSNFLTAFGDSATFTQALSVTPEPISTALFIFGGMPLAAGLIRRKRA
ncbi:MAG: PEP-CTERM sorting domain-containing protein [Candidatus Omnitrophica bacterium]|nr:PEP-CTERM sorting domain-containing protein [Candidatus Omnitrophota bacterium]